MRLFVACALPDDYVRTLTAAQHVLEELAGNIRLTGKEQLHLTLRFIGKTGDDAARMISGWFKDLPGSGMGALRFRQGNYGVFDTGEGQLVWSGLQCRDELLSYVNRLEEGLRGLGLPPETRRWLPHVTLARHAALRCPFEDILPLLPRDARAFTLGDPALFRSDFTPDGMRYTMI